jgi:starch-binding outer membrane protein, SusD/RagB family
MKHILLLLVLGLGLMLGSCQKFLEEAPTGSLTSESSITSNPGGQALVMGAYRSTNDLMSGAEWGDLGMASFEYLSGKAFAQYMTGVILFDIETNSYSGDRAYCQNAWNSWYQGVRDCNLAIIKIPEVAQMSDVDKSKALGQLHALRAYYYFNLVRHFGDVVYNTEVITDLASVARPRSSLKTIYDKIIVPDLQLAVASDLDEGRSTTGMITRLTARTLLADVYLTMAGYPYQEVNADADTSKQWCAEGLWTMSGYPVNTSSAKELLQKAKEQIDLVISNGGWQPLANYSYDNLHNPTNGNNKGEAIFQIQYLRGTRTNNIIAATLPIGSGIMADDTYGTMVPGESYSASYLPIDKRIQDRQMFFYTDTKHPSRDINTPPVAKFPVPFLYKYYDVDAVKGPPGGSSMNFNIYRLADVLLMQTEINWTLGQLGSPVPEIAVLFGINEVRERANLPAYAITDINLKTIMAERAYELIFERKMLWDQRRTRMALIDGEGEFSGIENLVGHHPVRFNYSLTKQHLLTPISSTEIDNNRNCLQNFGFAPQQVGQ